MSTKQAALSCSPGWGQIEKSVFTKEYELCVRQLREMRKSAGLTQQQVADRLHHHQRFVSRCETGERRLDIIELRAFCEAIGIPFKEFVDKLEDALAQMKSQEKL